MDGFAALLLAAAHRDGPKAQPAERVENEEMDGEEHDGAISPEQGEGERLTRTRGNITPPRIVGGDSTGATQQGGHASSTPISLLPGVPTATLSSGLPTRDQRPAANKQAATTYPAFFPSAQPASGTMMAAAEDASEKMKADASSMMPFMWPMSAGGVAGNTAAASHATTTDGNVVVPSSDMFSAGRAFAGAHPMAAAHNPFFMMPQMPMFPGSAGFFAFAPGAAGMMPNPAMFNPAAAYAAAAQQAGSLPTAVGHSSHQPNGFMYAAGPGGMTAFAGPMAMAMMNGQHPMMLAASSGDSHHHLAGSTTARPGQPTGRGSISIHTPGTSTSATATARTAPSAPRIPMQAAPYPTTQHQPPQQQAPMPSSTLRLGTSAASAKPPAPSNPASRPAPMVLPVRSSQGAGVSLPIPSAAAKIKPMDTDPASTAPADPMQPPSNPDAEARESGAATSQLDSTMGNEHDDGDRNVPGPAGAVPAAVSGDTPAEDAAGVPVKRRASEDDVGGDAKRVRTVDVKLEHAVVAALVSAGSRGHPQHQHGNGVLADGSSGRSPVHPRSSLSSVHSELSVGPRAGHSRDDSAEPSATSPPSHTSDADSPGDIPSSPHGGRLRARSAAAAVGRVRRPSNGAGEHGGAGRDQHGGATEDGPDLGGPVRDESARSAVIQDQKGRYVWNTALIQLHTCVARSDVQGLLVFVGSRSQRMTWELLNQPLPPPATGYILHLAAAIGDRAMCGALLNIPALVDVIDATGTTPLHCAAREGHGDVVQLLLDHGADPRIERSRDGFTPERVALVHGHKHVVGIIRAWCTAAANRTATGSRESHHALPGLRPTQVPWEMSGGARGAAARARDRAHTVVVMPHGK